MSNDEDKKVFYVSVPTAYFNLYPKKLLIYFCENGVEIHLNFFRPLQIKF